MIFIGFGSSEVPRAIKVFDSPLILKTRTLFVVKEIGMIALARRLIS